MPAQACQIQQNKMCYYSKSSVSLYNKRKQFDNLLSLSSCYTPFGDGRTATAGRDDDVTFTGDGRQSHDAVESEKRHTHTVQIATYNSGMNKRIEILFYI